jgi:Deoxyribonuclease II
MKTLEIVIGAALALGIIVLVALLVPGDAMAKPMSAVPSTHPSTTASVSVSDAPVPLPMKDHPVDWWFAFKFNAATFPGCSATKTCTFGGTVKTYASSQQFVYATSDQPRLQMRTDCIGQTTADPLGATFDQIYNGSTYYVVWNDQFYGDPQIPGCTVSCSAPWGHSKGLVAWNDSGRGLVLQVSTPSWPAAASVYHPRDHDGNTLGCVTDDDVEVSQHFFALALTKDDLVAVLRALENASVVTDPTNPQIVRNGGPPDVAALVINLGKQSASTTPTKDTLSTGVVLISKPSHLPVPPWQMVSALLGGVSLRTATWWTEPAIPTTTTSTAISCWATSLGKPGPVEIAVSGRWQGKSFGLKGGAGTNFNHAKLGVSTSGAAQYAIFGDMNQQGALSGNCASSQNGRGGLFFAVENDELASSVSDLIRGDTAPPQ